MIAIAAVSRNWGIGADNDLLFHIPEDLRFFHRMTDGQTMIIGRKNLESFPGGRPLEGRRHLVLTGRSDYTCEGCEIFSSLSGLKPVLATLPPEEVWVCGGGIVYRELLPYCSGAWITEVDDERPCDVFFPDLTQLENWVCTEQGEWKEHKGLRYRFCHWTNRTPQPLSSL